MKKTKLKIHIYGSPALRQKSKDVTDLDDSIREILDQMLELMYEDKGIGLASNQVGILQRLVVVDLGKGPLKLVNPRITRKSGSIALEEGCLSLPGIIVKVKRANEIEVEALNEKGYPLKIKAEGLLAVCLQHEIDHLDGILLIDYMPFFNRIKAKRKLLEASKNLKVTPGESTPEIL